MKTIAIIAMITLLSCTKEDNAPTPIAPNPQCDCGIVQKWNVRTGYATVHNLCTGEEESIFTGREAEEGEIICQ